MEHEYQIVKSLYTDLFVENLERELQQGWEPHGNVVVNPVSGEWLILLVRYNDAF